MIGDETALTACVLEPVPLFPLYQVLEIRTRAVLRVGIVCDDELRERSPRLTT